MVDILGHKSRELLKQAQQVMLELQGQMQQDIEDLKNRQESLDERVENLETKNEKLVEDIASLQKSVNSMRISAIRGEIASGQKTVDVASKYGLTPSRISQIAPRRRFNNG